MISGSAGTAVRHRFRSRGSPVIIVIGTAVVLALGAATRPVVDAALVPLVAGLLALLALCRALRPADPSQAHRIVVLAVTAFLAHLAIGVVINSSSTLVRYLGGDAVTYDQGARQIVAHWHDSGAPFPFIGPGKEGFYYLLAGLYWVFGAFPIAGLAVNAFLSASLVPLMYDLTRRLFGSSAGWVAAIIVTLQPGFLIWTSQLLREAGVIFLLVAALDCAVRLADRVTPGIVVLLAMAVTVLLTFRADVGLMAAGGLAVGFILGRKRIVSSAFSVLAVVLMLVVLVGAVGLGKKGYQATSSVTLNQVSTARSDLSSSAASGFDQTANVSTPGLALSYLPRGLPSFMLGPFPWQLRNVRQLLGGLEALTVIALIPAVGRGWRLARRSTGRRWLLLVLPAAGLALSLALVIGNYGTVVRERLQVTVFLIPLAAYGIADRQARRSERSQGSHLQRSASDATLGRQGLPGRPRLG